MLLNYESEALFGIELWRRLWGVFEAAFAFVFFKGHITVSVSRINHGLDGTTMPKPLGIFPLGVSATA